MIERDIGTRALLLRSVDYGDSDRVVTLLTEANGKVGCFARGARRSSRKFRGGIGPFQVLQVRYDLKTEGLSVLRDSEADGNALAIGADLHKVAIGSWTLELLDATLGDRQGGGDWFGRTLRWVDWLAQESRGPVHLEAGTQRMQVLLLHELGLFPDLGRCARSGDSLLDASRLLWLPGAGMIDAARRFVGESGIDISLPVWEHLLRLAEGRFGDLEPGVVAETRHVFFEVWHQTLNIALRSEEFYRSSFGATEIRP